jgi:hypothetical protein
VGGTVPPTLALTIDRPASFGAFTPGTAKDYSASTTASVTSTAGDATLSIADSSAATAGHLVNGAFSLASPLEARAGSAAFGTLSGAPLSLRSYSAPTSNDAVALEFRQHVDANEPLRTGSYSKTLTLTLSTTTP